MGFKKIYLYGMDNTYTKYLNNDGEYVIDKNLITLFAHNEVKTTRTILVAGNA